MVIKAVLFDLDGTLADTAPDLGYALNETLKSRGKPALPLAKIRPVVSGGVRALLKLGFDIEPEHPDYEALRTALLDVYTHNFLRETKLFPGMDELLAALEQRGLKWGVVTNKPARFTLPLIAALKLNPGCVISADTTPHMKPHPEPLFEACRRLHLAPTDCIYVGDDERDVQAAHAAGMPAIVAGFGYLNGSNPVTWHADAMIATPLDLVDWIDELNNRH